MQQPDYIPYSRKKRKSLYYFLAISAALAVFGIFVYQIPRVNRFVNYRLDIAKTYVSKLIHPVSNLPTPAVKNEAEIPVADQE